MIQSQNTHSELTWQKNIPKTEKSSWKMRRNTQKNLVKSDQLISIFFFSWCYRIHPILAIKMLLLECIRNHCKCWQCVILSLSFLYWYFCSIGSVKKLCTSMMRMMYIFCSMIENAYSCHWSKFHPVSICLFCFQQIITFYKPLTWWLMKISDLKDKIITHK